MQLLHKTLFFDIAIPLLLMTMIAPWTSQFDLAFASYFYDPSSTQFSSNPFFTFFYDWGLLPGQLLGIGAFIALILSFYKPKFKYLRYPALVIGLTIAIGAGLITQVVLKDHWKRPRPKQVEQFGGSESFRTFYEPNFTAKGNFKSFPSGHCTMGFCFFAVAVIGRRWQSRALFLGGLGLAISLGVFLALARIAQGGHFFSDTVAAACLMWITAACCEYFCSKLIIPMHIHQVKQ
jgi:membrane-associated PAP2 superfamily phosphatase